MFVDVSKTGQVRACRIAGYGHSVLGEELRYDNRRFIKEILTPAGKRGLANDLGLVTYDKDDRQKENPKYDLEQVAEAGDEKFTAATGIASRYIFPGSTAELGAMAATAALADAQVSPSQLDAIIVATNTGRGYPSTADTIKCLLGEASAAACYDLQEACTGSVAALFDGWTKIRAGTCRRVLVVGCENALNLATKDDYKKSNLFGSAAFGLVLEAASAESFHFFTQDADPFDSRLDWIQRKENGFSQAGRSVHKFVGREIPKLIDQACVESCLDLSELNHLFLHMPSQKTLDLLVGNLRKRWPTFKGHVHENISTHGNTSAASVGWLLSRAKHQGLLRPGDTSLLWAFGSGISWAGTAFTA